MVKARCIQKFRDSSGKIIGYLLVDNNGQQTQMESKQLKKAIASRQLNVTNLTLTMDNRLIDSTIKEDEHIDLSRKIVSALARYGHKVDSIAREAENECTFDVDRKFGVKVCDHSYSTGADNHVITISVIFEGKDGSYVPVDEWAATKSNRDVLRICKLMKSRLAGAEYDNKRTYTSKIVKMIKSMNSSYINKASISTDLDDEDFCRIDVVSANGRASAFFTIDNNGNVTLCTPNFTDDPNHPQMDFDENSFSINNNEEAKKALNILNLTFEFFEKPEEQRLEKYANKIVSMIRSANSPMIGDINTFYEYGVQWRIDIKSKHNKTYGFINVNVDYAGEVILTMCLEDLNDRDNLIEDTVNASKSGVNKLLNNLVKHFSIAEAA